MHIPTISHHTKSTHEALDPKPWVMLDGGGIFVLDPSLTWKAVGTHCSQLLIFHHLADGIFLHWQMAFPSHKPSPPWLSLSLESCKQSNIQHFLPSHCNKSLPPRAPALSTDSFLQKEGCGGTASISSWLRPKAKKQ